jgi:GNAT superfamily N-acetyltransferase
MQAARAEMQITIPQLPTEYLYVLEISEQKERLQQEDLEQAELVSQTGHVIGFYQLRGMTTWQVELTDLFVDPTAIGQGWGKILWKHAVETASSRGYSEMTWQSDPHAEGFYLHMGAQRVGLVGSSVKPGRLLPKMRYQLQE